MAIERVTAVQRRFVFARAKGFCEYCHTPEGFVPGSFAIEHINPRSKGGKTILRNLALSCPACNSHKFDKVWGVDPVSQMNDKKMINLRRLLILAELHPPKD